MQKFSLQNLVTPCSLCSHCYYCGGAGELCCLCISDVSPMVINNYAVVVGPRNTRQAHFVTLPRAGDLVGTGQLNGINPGFLLSGAQLPPLPPVVNSHPVAVAGAPVTAGKAPLDVVCSGAGSHDPDGAAVACCFDFGGMTSGSGMNRIRRCTRTATPVPAWFCQVLPAQPEWPPGVRRWKSGCARQVAANNARPGLGQFARLPLRPFRHLHAPLPVSSGILAVEFLPEI